MQFRGSWGEGQVPFSIHKGSHLFRRADSGLPCSGCTPVVSGKCPHACTWRKTDTRARLAREAGSLPCCTFQALPREGGPPNVEVTTRGGWIASQPGRGWPISSKRPIPSRRTGPLPWSGRPLTRGETLPSGRIALGETGETGNPFTRLCRGGRGWEEGGGNGLLLQVCFSKSALCPAGQERLESPGSPEQGQGEEIRVQRKR